MPTHTAFPPPAPVTQPDGDARPATAPEAVERSERSGPSRAREVSPGEISREAYARYLERGREDGHDVEDWLAAEARLRQQDEQ